MGTTHRKPTSKRTTKTDPVGFAFSDVPRAVGFLETAEWGPGAGGSCVMGTEFQFCKMEELWRLTRGQLDNRVSAPEQGAEKGLLW